MRYNSLEWPNMNYKGEITLSSKLLSIYDDNTHGLLSKYGSDTMKQVSGNPSD